MGNKANKEKEKWKVNKLNYKQRADDKNNIWNYGRRRWIIILKTHPRTGKQN